MMILKVALTGTGVIGAGFSGDADFLDDRFAFVFPLPLTLFLQLVYARFVTHVVAVWKQQWHEMIGVLGHDSALQGYTGPGTT